MALLLLTLGANAENLWCASMFEHHHLGGDYYNIKLDCDWHTRAMSDIATIGLGAFFGGEQGAVQGIMDVFGNAGTCNEDTNLPVAKNDWNDRVSSFWVQPGCELRLYAHADTIHWTGQAVTDRDQIGGVYTTGTRWNLVGPWDDIVSKFKCSCEFDAWNQFYTQVMNAANNAGRRREGSSVSEALLDLQDAATAGTTTFDEIDSTNALQAHSCDLHPVTGPVNCADSSDSSSDDSSDDADSTTG